MLSSLVLFTKSLTLHKDWYAYEFSIYVGSHVLSIKLSIHYKTVAFITVCLHRSHNPPHATYVSGIYSWD